MFTVATIAVVGPIATIAIAIVAIADVVAGPIAIADVVVPIRSSRIRPEGSCSLCPCLCSSSTNPCPYRTVVVAGPIAIADFVVSFPILYADSYYCCCLAQQRAAKRAQAQAHSSGWQAAVIDAHQHMHSTVQYGTAKRSSAVQY